PTIWSKALSATTFATRFLLTLAVVLGATALALVVFLAELHNAMVGVRAGGQHWLPIAAGVALLLLVAFFDQTRMSMHPFYKSRLASAFDVTLEGGVATQPDYGHLSTLSDYGRPIGDDGKVSPAPNGGLRLVLCAAAHVSGPSLAPPGRRVVPFVFSSDFIGSPKLGYFPTKGLEDALTTKTYRSDITLLAASAISGAAFASSMGRASGPLDLLLALSNARLGAWLPNPRYHGLRSQKPELLPDQDRDRTPLPTIRRLGYFAREVFGVYPANDRFVYVTDGGHYENLGLVELLRRRCHTIYCVDASGDHSMAFTLAEAAALAYEELGVTITIDGFPLAAMSADEGEELNADLRSLHERLSQQSVVVGTVSYPPGAGSPSKGILIVGKATLGQDLEGQPEMFPLKSYAVTQKDFPGDTTADQWFEVDQFQGYVALGRLVGQRMSEI
ncbi:MAG: patatin-like phospholipase family protein, partial [Dermatophilaceae bacterium]|nr:patatin-like phospholipase family protein [Dermatophilaceae bacterium]